MLTSDSEWSERTETSGLVDRTGWQDGPWTGEPDRVEWRYHGPPRLPCLIVRSHSMGALCGYVGVPPGHPAHGKGTNDDDAAQCSVHGGITYASPCDEASGLICHVPRAGESPDVWWLGFDCGHASDVMPGLTKVRMPPDLFRALRLGRDWEYRDLAYVRAEVEQLAAQLARAAKGEAPA